MNGHVPFLRTFGAPVLYDARGNPVALRGKPLAVVIYLALNTEKKFTRDDIARTVWGAKVGKSGLRSLYEACSRVNKRVPGLLHEGGLHLSLQMVPRSDAQALVEAKMHPELRGAALAGYGARFLAGATLTDEGTEFAQWAQVKRGELHLLYQDLWLLEARALEAAEDRARLIALAHSARSADPGWEEPGDWLDRALRARSRHTASGREHGAEAAERAEETGTAVEAAHGVAAGTGAGVASPARNMLPDEAEGVPRETVEGGGGADRTAGGAWSEQPGAVLARPDRAAIEDGARPRRAGRRVIVFAAGALACLAAVTMPRWTREGAGEWCRAGAARVAYVDEDYQRGYRLRPGQHFTKAWRVANSGRCTWDPSFRLVMRSRFRDGVPWPDGKLSLALNAVQVTHPVKPDSIYEFVVPMQAPPAEGHYEENWVIEDGRGGVIPVDRTGTLVAQIVVDPTYVERCEPGGARGVVVARSHLSTHPLPPNQPFVYSWSVRNTGVCEWAPGLRALPTGGRVLRVADSAAVSTEPVRPGQVATLSFSGVTPRRSGMHAETWLLQDSSGTPAQLGTAGELTSEIRVGVPGEAPTGATCGPAGERARFVGETVPDNTIIPLGQAFTKAWTVMNSGVCAWRGGVHLHRLSRHTLSSSTTHAVAGSILPMETVTFRVPMQAPRAPGALSEYWELHDRDHRRILISRSPWLSVVIIVRD